MRTRANNAQTDRVEWRADGQAMAEYMKRYGLEADWQGWLTKAGERVAYKIDDSKGGPPAFIVVWIDPARREMVLNPTARKVTAAGTKATATFTLTCEGNVDAETVAGRYLAQDQFRDWAANYIEGQIDPRFHRHDEEETDAAGAEAYMHLESVSLDRDSLTVESDFSVKIRGTATYEYAVNSEYGTDDVLWGVGYALAKSIEDNIPGAEIDMDKPVRAIRMGEDRFSDDWVRGQYEDIIMYPADPNNSETGIAELAARIADKTGKEPDLAAARRLWKKMSAVGAKSADSWLAHAEAMLAQTRGAKRAASLKPGQRYRKMSPSERMSFLASPDWTGQAEDGTLLAGGYEIEKDADGNEETVYGWYRPSDESEIARANEQAERAKSAGKKLYYVNATRSTAARHPSEYVSVSYPPNMENSRLPNYRDEILVTLHTRGTWYAIPHPVWGTIRNGKRSTHRPDENTPFYVEFDWVAGGDDSDYVRVTEYRYGNAVRSFVAAGLSQEEAEEEWKENAESRREYGKQYTKEMDDWNKQFSADAARVRAEFKMTGVGEEEYSPEQVKAAIARLEWEDTPAKGNIDLPFMQGEALKKVIQEYKLPRPAKLALYGTIAEGHGFYGAEFHYKNADLILYIADTGTETFVVAKDVTMKPETTAGKVEFLRVGDTVRFLPGTYFEGKVGEIVDTDTKRTDWDQIETVYEVRGEGIDDSAAESWATADELERVEAQRATASAHTDWNLNETMGATKYRARTSVGKEVEVYVLGSPENGKETALVRFEDGHTERRRVEQLSNMEKVTAQRARAERVTEIKGPDGKVMFRIEKEYIQQYPGTRGKLTWFLDDAGGGNIVNGDEAYVMKELDRLMEKHGIGKPIAAKAKSANVAASRIKAWTEKDDLPENIRGKVTFIGKGYEIKKQKGTEEPTYVVTFAANEVVGDNDTEKTYDIGLRSENEVKMFKDLLKKNMAATAKSVKASLSKEEAEYEKKNGLSFEQYMENVEKTKGMMATEEYSQPEQEHRKEYEEGLRRLMKKGWTAVAKSKGPMTDETYAVHGDSEFYRTGDNFWFSDDGRLIALTEAQADEVRGALAESTALLKTEEDKILSVRNLVKDLGLLKQKRQEMKRMATRAELQTSHGDRVEALTRKVLSLAQAVKSVYAGPVGAVMRPIADRIGIKARQIYNETHTQNWVTASLVPMSRDPKAIRASITELEREVRELRLPLGLANVMAHRLKDELKVLKNTMDNL